MLDAGRLDIIYQPGGRAREYAPLACNLAVGCSHGCRYCYGPSASHKGREAFMAGPVPVKNALERLERDARRLQEVGDDRTTLFSFLTDPFSADDWEAHDLTGEAVKIMAYHERPFTVLTKGAWEATVHLPLYAPRDSFATTLVFTDEADREHWEPGADPLALRWEVLADAISRGIDTWISLEPVIEPAQALAVVRRAADAGIGHVKIGPLNYHPHAESVDWRRFGRDLADVLTEIDIDYYLKHDMRPHMPQDFPVTTIDPPRGVEPPLTCAVCGAEVVMPSDPEGGLFAPEGPLRCSHDPTHEHGC